MAKDNKVSMERFKVYENVLKLTPRFDPRYQSRAATEMMNIISSLAAESTVPEVVLDISDSTAIPSMMFGMLCEARTLTDKAGKKLKIRLKTETFNRFQALGLAGLFSSPPRENGVPGDLELVADAITSESE